MQWAGRYGGMLGICARTTARTFPVRFILLSVTLTYRRFCVLAAGHRGGKLRVAYHFLEETDEGHCCVRDEQELPLTL